MSRSDSSLVRSDGKSLRPPPQTVTQLLGAPLLWRSSGADRIFLVPVDQAALVPLEQVPWQGQVASRATVSIRDAEGSRIVIISPRNDSKLQYVAQPAMPTHRIGFSMPIALKQGFADLEIIYQGDEVRNVRQRADHIVRTSGVQMDGIKLFRSSDRHLTELVPADHLFRVQHKN